MTIPIIPTASAIAVKSRRSIASASHDPMPGRVTVVLPTVIASDATTKNQPPDIDIIAFHTRAGVAKGRSSRRKRRIGDSAKPWVTSSRSAGIERSDW